VDKQQEIIKMFDNIAKTYDLANRILSMGVDRKWRKIACNLAYRFYEKDTIDKIVDVACGTGDLMIDWLNVAQDNGIDIKEIVGVDPSEGMVEVGKNKLDASFIISGAEDIPLEDNSTDFVSISYGIRNVVKRKEGLSEFARILKPGGMAMILEFFKPKENSFNSIITKPYLNYIMPYIGGIISKDLSAYKYLPNSINQFITVEQMKQELQEVGLKPIFVKGYSFDISTTIIAKKCL
jgi:demethylmenaquinone methyltransferase/2-methoxy-6-polyprenyl-1,4-benzoquinol methylase